jgi:hypothetical protein
MRGGLLPPISIDHWKDPKSLKDRIMLTVDDKVMNITEEGCVQLLRLQKVDVTAVQPYRDGKRFISETMRGLVGSFRLWIMALDTIMFKDTREFIEKRVIRDMNNAANEMNAFALEYKRYDMNGQDNYAYNQLKRALHEDVHEFCKELARRSDRAALVGDIPRKCEITGCYLDSPSPPTFRTFEIDRIVRRNSHVRDKLKELPMLSEQARGGGSSDVFHANNMSTYTHKRQRSSKPPSKLCYKWRDTGSCNREGCPYTHEVVATTTAPVPQKAAVNTSHTQPKAPAKK